MIRASVDRELVKTLLQDETLELSRDRAPCELLRLERQVDRRASSLEGSPTHNAECASPTEPLHGHAMRNRGRPLRARYRRHLLRRVANVATERRPDVKEKDPRRHAGRRNRCSCNEHLSDACQLP